MTTETKAAVKKGFNGLPPKVKKMVTKLRAEMKTQEAVNKFIEDCRYRGLSPNTIMGWNSHLKHFVLEFPEVPTDLGPIDRFLTRVIKKKTARYNIRKTLLAFYKYLQEHQGIANPIPLKSAGRPKKPIESLNKSLNKLGMGGSDSIIRVDLHVFIHSPGD